MYGLIVLALVASASASIYSNQQCPAVRPVENFNLEAYGNGLWYEIGRYPNTPEHGAQCGTTQYQLVSPDTIQIRSYHVLNGRFATIDGSARLAPPTACSSNQGKLIFSLPYGANRSINEYVGWVLDTDYVNYAIVYQCSYDSQKQIRRDLAWILSRTKTLDASTKAKIDQYIAHSTILDANKFIYPDFSEASCTVVQ